MLTTATLIVAKDAWKAQVIHSTTNPQETKAVLISPPQPASGYYLATSDKVWKEQIRAHSQSPISITHRMPPRYSRRTPYCLYTVPCKAWPVEPNFHPP